MGKKRRTTIDRGESESPSPEEIPTEDLLERIRQLEEQNGKLEEQKGELEEKIRRIEKENEIFRKVLETKEIDADGVLVKFLAMDAENALEEVRELRRKANMNSGNSSLPPSSDRPWQRSKKRSLRAKTGRKPGGQKGHPGNTVRLPHEADRIVMLYPAGCEKCSKKEECESLGAFSCAETRSVMDLKIETTVTEYRALRRTGCPFADTGSDTGVFPEDVKAFIQYGNGVTTLVGILDAYGAMSDKRIADVVNGMSGLEMASSTVVSMTERCARAVNPALKPIADAIAKGSVTNCDETGSRAVVEEEDENGPSEGDADKAARKLVSRNVWIHGASNRLFTYLRMSRSRGYAGMAEAGILGRLKGTVVHDCWAPYWKFEGLRHAVCNAHILRELKGVTENRPEHGWAQMFIDLLIRMKETKEAAVASGAASLPEDVLEGFHRRFAEILDIADAECPPPPPPSEKKRGRKKKGKERALIERLREREAEICLFVRDLSIPFDNNLAERGFRPVKVKTKVSGCYRSDRCLQQYLDIMSYIDTARKHGVSAFKAMTMAFEGRWAEAIGLSGGPSAPSEAGH